MPACDLYLLPTAGWPVPEDDGHPSRLRLRKAYWQCAIQIANRQDCGVAIIGGHRDEGPSEAEAYYVWARTHFGAATNMTALVSDGALCTPRDLFEANSVIVDYLHSQGIRPDEATIGVVTYWEHFLRIRITLQALGYDHTRILWVDSGEPCRRLSIVEWATIAITWLDPFWTTIGLPLVWKSARRAKLTIPPNEELRA